ncbi:hypothetical protein BJ123_10235 [Rhodopseudomonas thermotolerans]|uniref:Outer membrane beta-barrel porin/alpha-amylase n=3 Tax=Nitrobacteraceae TaxID=41294 RepID=A0A336JHI3_9BRAD|nr:hypothetical protein BJ125_10235 [Rhodopseudomonas pentothenatexigens]REG07334.1 hypothetical protein BJ123_10235 [Rhodopseudomonas thermotolerans]SSW89230.1 hypothetical protein SAMN05892882_10235 [Rhodopseudomonas pentothenatexigens]
MAGSGRDRVVPRHMAAVAAAAVSLQLAVAPALAADDDDAPAQTYPNIYLDLRTSYGRTPAGVLSIGFASPTIAVLSRLRELAALPPLQAPTLPASQSVELDVPLTIDVNDRVSLYGGFSTTTSKSGAGWSSVDITSWNVGFQADIYRQDGGALPTLTLQTTLTRSVPSGPLATTSVNTVLEASYAFDADETRGVLAGVQFTTTAIDADRAAIRPNTIGWLGGYYQWDSNWKLTGRAGLQSFGGAELLRFTPIDAFTQPILRIDLDKMDDNDNRLFGITAQVSWTPKPAYQLTVRTPLYLTKN